MSNKDELLENVLINIKKDYENAIINGGEPQVHSLIRSQNLINYLHEYVKTKLVLEGIPQHIIFPPLKSSKPEIKLSGFLKTKNQDITVLGLHPQNEIIERGVLKGKKDKISKHTMDVSLSINVRSQLSSLAKNFDTLFERTFAESLNLHLRSPELVMGELYMVPLFAYDPKKIQKNEIGWKEQLPIEKYIPAFSELNNRKDTATDHYKYERVSLLIVDFREEIPVEINTNKKLLDTGLVTEEQLGNIDLNELNTSNLVSDLLNCYKERHGSIDNFTKNKNLDMFKI